MVFEILKNYLKFIEKNEEYFNLFFIIFMIFV